MHGMQVAVDELNAWFKIRINPDAVIHLQSIFQYTDNDYAEIYSPHTL